MTFDRYTRYQRTAAALAKLSDDALAAMVGAGVPGDVGIGGGAVMLAVNEVPIFAKRIPMTDEELARPRSTANLFDLPVFCQYGASGPTFGGWRELEANLIVTEGVLSGATQAFPLLYHWRVLPGRPPIAAEHADIDAVVSALDGSAAVRHRLGRLAAASHSLVLFLEYLPLSLRDWLREDPVAKAELVERQLMEIVDFLSGCGLLHMDGHFGNMLSDGQQIYLADFGLATSPHFELSSAERNFVRRNVTHDAGYAAMGLVNWLVKAAGDVTASGNGGTAARNEYVRRCAEGRIPDDLPKAVAGILARHAPAAARMNAFYWEIFGGNVRAEYPEEWPYRRAAAASRRAETSTSMTCPAGRPTGTHTAAPR